MMAYYSKEPTGKKVKISTECEKKPNVVIWVEWQMMQTSIQNPQWVN